MKKRIYYEWHSQDLRIKQTDTCPTLNAAMGMGGANMTTPILIATEKQNNKNPTYGIDRYAWNQGYDAKYDFQIFEEQEPCLISRGGAAVAAPRNLKNGNYTKGR